MYVQEAKTIISEFGIAQLAKPMSILKNRASVGIRNVVKKDLIKGAKMSRLEKNVDRDYIKNRLPKIKHVLGVMNRIGPATT